MGNVVCNQSVQFFEAIHFTNYSTFYNLIIAIKKNEILPMLSEKFVNSVENILRVKGLQIKESLVSNHFHGWVMNYTGVYNESVNFRFEYSRSSIYQNFLLNFDILLADSHLFKSKSSIETLGLKHYLTINRYQYGQYVVQGEFKKIIDKNPTFQNVLKELDLNGLSVKGFNNSVNIMFKSKREVEVKTLEIILTKMLIIVHLIPYRS